MNSFSLAFLSFSFCRKGKGSVLHVSRQQIWGKKKKEKTEEEKRKKTYIVNNCEL